MQSFTPFSVELSELKAIDLKALEQTPEGWYIEYKSEISKSSSIAKTVSAFANTYGGWVFYGVEEKSKEESVAGSFPGIARSESEAALQRIRQACGSAINPTPHFEVKILWGPEPEIGLGPDRCIISIYVPQGSEAPYVHSSGMIYRRVGDGSEPKPETDRAILDQLWSRREKTRRSYREWLERKLELSDAEQSLPYVRIFITPDLWRDQNIWADLTTSKVREIFSGKIENDETFISTPFDVIYKSSSGYVCRQGNGNDPQNLSVTWFLNPNLTSEVVIPLHQIIDVETDDLEYYLSGYDNAKAYISALKTHAHDKPRIIDFNFLYNSLIGVFHIQMKLDEVAKRSGPVYVKAELINVFRARPFLDVKQVTNYQLKYGVPVCMRGNFFSPPGTDPDTFLSIQPPKDFKPAIDKVIRAAVTFEPIAIAFGIETMQASDFEGESRTNIHGDLVGAGQRAVAAQDIRNKRRKEEEKYR